MKPENVKKFKDEIELKKLNLDEKSETVKDKDSIDYYNRKYGKKKDGITTIPGCFGRVRQTGGASAVDCDKYN